MDLGGDLRAGTCFVDRNGPFGVYSVFIRLDEEGYKKQEVKLGANNGAEVQILSGLKPGDTVVTQGAYQVKLASASNAIPAHTHNH